MLDERSLRRAEFQGGFPVRLADRQNWQLPTPEDLVGRPLDASRRAHYQSLTLGIVEAESREELNQAELALTIFLLSQNYYLNPTSCFEMLSFEPGDPELSELQATLHHLAMDHVRVRGTSVEVRTTAGPSVRTPRLSFLRRVRATISA